MDQAEVDGSSKELRRCFLIVMNLFYRLSTGLLRLSHNLLNFWSKHSPYSWFTAYMRKLGVSQRGRRPTPSRRQGKVIRIQVHPDDDVTMTGVQVMWRSRG